MITAGPRMKRLTRALCRQLLFRKDGLRPGRECPSRSGGHTHRRTGAAVAQPPRYSPHQCGVGRGDVSRSTSRFPASDAAILCAAVADFTPVTTATQKIKREGDELLLRLRPTTDIAASLGEVKQPQVLVGLHSKPMTPNSMPSKLQRKNFDFIVLNSLTDEGRVSVTTPIK